MCMYIYIYNYKMYFYTRDCWYVFPLCWDFFTGYSSFQKYAFSLGPGSRIEKGRATQVHSMTEDLL